MPGPDRARQETTTPRQDAAVPEVSAIRNDDGRVRKESVVFGAELAVVLEPRRPKTEDAVALDQALPGNELFDR